MDKEQIQTAYMGIRYVEIICLAVFIFGTLWTGTDLLQLSFQQFMMLYGGCGALLSEAIARVLHKYLKKKVTHHSYSQGEISNG